MKDLKSIDNGIQITKVLNSKMEKMINNPQISENLREKFSDIIKNPNFYDWMNKSDKFNQNAKNLNFLEEEIKKDKLNTKKKEVLGLFINKEKHFLEHKNFYRELSTEKNKKKHYPFIEKQDIFFDKNFEKLNNIKNKLKTEENLTYKNLSLGRKRKTISFELNSNNDNFWNKPIRENKIEIKNSKLNLVQKINKVNRNNSSQNKITENSNFIKNKKEKFFLELKYITLSNDNDK